MPTTCFLKRWIIPFLILTTHVHSGEVDLKFTPLNKTKDTFFETNRALSQIITNQPEVQLDGSYDGGSPFILLNINDKEFPKYLQNRHFAQQITLRPGTNTIKATTPQGYQGEKSYKIVNINGGNIKSVHFSCQGEDSEAKHFQQNALPVTPINTSTPIIEVRGTKAQPETAKISVKDHYGNPVQVINDNHEFVVHYTLREGSNELTFRSSFDDKTFKTDTLSFDLNNVITIEADGEKNGVFLEKGMTANSYSFQGNKLSVKGSVASIAEGKVSLIINDTTSTVPVTNHKFETKITLQPEALNVIKASITTGSQTFFDHIEVTQITPKSSIQYLTELTLDGTIFLDKRTLIPEEGKILETHSPALKIGGKSSFLGDLHARIRNKKTGKTYKLDKGSGKFETTVFLDEGENQLEVLFGLGENTSIVESATVTLLPPIIIEQINDFLPTSETTTIKTPECQIRGRIPSINRGLLTLSFNNTETIAPIMNGRFETDNPLILNAGENTIVASFKTKDEVFSKSLVVEVSLPEETTLVQDTPVSEVAIAVIPQEQPTKSEALTEASIVEKQPHTDKEEPLENRTISNQAQEANSNPAPVESPKEEKPKGKFTPPSPVKTSQPKDVKDPATGQRLTGSVTVKFTINKKGRIDSESITILDSTNDVLNPEAIRAISKWRFRAAKMDNKAIELSTKITLNWRDK